MHTFSHDKLLLTSNLLNISVSRKMRRSEQNIFNENFFQEGCHGNEQEFWLQFI